jgi:hypothetical protein
LANIEKHRLLDAMQQGMRAIDVGGVGGVGGVGRGGRKGVGETNSARLPM